eukprot:g16347.t1
MKLYLHDIRTHNYSDSGDFPDKSAVQIFAANESGSPVFVSVKNFRPWFYLELPAGVDAASLYAEFESQLWFKNVVTWGVVYRERFVGFADGKRFKYVYVEFTGVVPMYCGRKKVREANTRIRIHEDKVDPVLKFFHSTRLRPSSYFETIGEVAVLPSLKQTHCQEEYSVDVRGISPVSADMPPPPMVMCGYDIESSGLDPKTDYVFQVSMCFSRLGDELAEGQHATEACRDGIVICVGETESVDGTPICVVANEVELLRKFRDVLVESGAMVMVGYNNTGFDDAFMYKRAVDTYSMQDFSHLGLIKDEACELQKKLLSSSALGSNELEQIVIPGRVKFDGLMVLRRTQKLSSYKLNSVCEHFFGGSKDDVSYMDILEAAKSRCPKKLGNIARYCFQDSWLVVVLLEKIKEIYNGMQMSKLCVVPLSFIENRGQQIKCFSLILDRIYGTYVCNQQDALGGDGKGYAGATVIEAQTGFHADDPVVCLDFASLYPSIMRWKNLCYTTYVTEDKYTGIDGVDYYPFETSPGHFETFASRPGKKAILSQIEEALGLERKATKREMKGEKDPFRHSLLNSKQLAQKVTANSLYGFCGTSRGMLPLVAIAAAVTCTGREMIQTTSEHVTSQGAVVIYGDTDSVMCKFPADDATRALGEKALLENAYQRGVAAAKEATGLFGHPVELEYENIYFPYLSLGKKCYSALSYDDASSAPKAVHKGIVVVRRDNAPIVRECVSEVLRLLMARSTTETVLAYVRGMLQRMEDGDVPTTHLVISKELKKLPWEYATQGPHSSLASKLFKRANAQKLFREVVRPLIESGQRYDDGSLCRLSCEVEKCRQFLCFELKEDVAIGDFVARMKSGFYKGKHGTSEWYENCNNSILNASVGDVRLVGAGLKNGADVEKYYTDFGFYDKIYWEAPRLGNRIPYVVIKGKGDMNNRSEDPRMVGKRVRIDVEYYICNQLKNPLVNILKHVTKDPESVFDDYIRRAKNVNKGRQEITSFFKRQKV